MTRPLLLAAGLLFAGCHSSTPARMPAPVPAPPSQVPATDTAASDRPHHAPRADFTGPAALPLAEFVSTGRPCRVPIVDPAPPRPERAPLERRRLFVATGPDRCTNQPRRAR